MTAEGPRLSIVIPVLNERESLPELRQRIADSVNPVVDTYELIFVDDGSEDGSAEIVEEWARAGEPVVLVQLSRNFGMEIAMSAGIDHARGHYVVLMHADLQDPPELIGEMLEEAERGADVVYARRIGRDEGRLKRTAATLFYGIMHRLARVPYQGQAGDFRLMGPRAVEAIRSMPERRRFLRGMVAWVGFRQVPIEYRRAGRSHGRGASYPELIRLALEALVSFSDVPLSLMTYLGFVTALASAVGAAVIVVLTLGGAIATSAEIWVLVAVLFIGGVQLIGLGILGRYLARVHEESLRRPLYLVARVVSGQDEPPR